MKTLTKCPYCRGEVETEAMKCRHCGEWIVEHKPAMTGPFLRTDETQQHQDRAWTRAPDATTPRIGWLGAATAAIGTLMPFFTLPLIGGISLFQGGRADGVIVMGAAVATGIGVWRQMRWLIVTAALVGLAVAGYDALSLARLSREMPIASLGIGAYAVLAGLAATLWSAFTELE